MDGHCKDCKHWERVTRETEHPFDDELAVSVGYGACHKIADGTLYYYENKDDRASVLTEDAAFTMDGSGYRSNIFTGPLFHCGLFEAKD